MIREWIGSIAGAVSVLILLYVSIRKTPSEAKSMESSSDKDDASAVDILEQSNARLADRVDKLQVRVDEQNRAIEANEAKHQAEIDAIKAEYAAKTAELDAKYQRVVEENTDLRDWAERLVHQVQSLGAEPVKLRFRTRSS